MKFAADFRSIARDALNGRWKIAVIACLIFFVLWTVYTVFLFRRKIFKKRYANSPAPVWKDDT